MSIKVDSTKIVEASHTDIGVVLIEAESIETTTPWLQTLRRAALV